MLPVVAVVVIAGWFGGTVATGQRGIGLSLVWLVPAMVSVVVAVMGMVIAGRSTQSGPNTSRPREDEPNSPSPPPPERAGRPRSQADTTPPTQPTSPIPNGPTSPSPPSLRGKGGTPDATPMPLVRGVWSTQVPADLAVAALLVTALAVVLWASDGVNHSWATTARARLATMAPLVLLVVLPMGWRLGGMTVGLATRIGLMGSIGIGAMAFFVATASGRLVTPDEWTIYAAAVGLVEHGKPVVFDGEPYRFTLTGTVPPPRPAEGNKPQWAPGKFSLVPTFVVAPIYGVARLLGAPDPATAAQRMPGDRAPLLVTMLVGPICAVFAVLATTSLSRAAGLDRSATVANAVVVATSSLIWPYASTIMNLSLAGATLAAATAAALRASLDGRLRDFALVGLLLGLAASSRYEFILLALPTWALVAFAAVGIRWRERSNTVRALLGAFAARGTIAVLAWSAVTLPLVFFMNLVRTGHVLDFGYGGEGFLASVLSKPWYGWFGLYLSSGCGLIVHAPMFVVAVAALAFLWDDDRSAAVVVAGIVLLGSVYYGSVSSTWCAQPAWGPRYMTSLMPVVLLPIGSLWARLTANGSAWRRNPFAWLALGVPFAANVVVNLLAILVDFGRGWQDHWALGATYQVAAWVPYFSGVTAHVRLLRSWILGGEASIDVQWLRGVEGTPTAGGTVAMVMLLVVAAACVGRAWRLAEQPPCD